MIRLDKKLTRGHGKTEGSIVRFFILFSKFFRPWLHGYVFRLYRFHLVAFSNRSTLNCIFKMLTKNVQRYNAELLPMEMKEAFDISLFNELHDWQPH